jgi:hypothetical protein
MGRRLREQPIRRVRKVRDDLRTTLERHRECRRVLGRGAASQS